MIEIEADDGLGRKVKALFSDEEYKRFVFESLVRGAVASAVMEGEGIPSDAEILMDEFNDRVR